MHVIKRNEDFIQFSRIEKEIQKFLAKYEGKLLNDRAPFNTIEPTMENIGEAMAIQVIEILNSSGWDLNKLEISENPTRTYIISNQNNVSDMFRRVAQLAKEINEGEEAAEAAKKVLYVEDSRLNDDMLDSMKDAGSIKDKKVIQEDAMEEVAASKEMLAEENIKNETVDSEVNNLSNKKDKKKNRLNYTAVSLGIVLAASVLLVLWVNGNGIYPWGSDTWGHLMKARLLYEEVMSGNVFPLYSDAWYNGIQPFRYWAPLPYYILLVFEFFTGGDAVLSYNAFIVFAFATGGAGWILWGVKTGRRKLALVLALLWFFMPENLRVFFAEGNIPRAAAAIVFPYLILAVWEHLENRNRKAVLYISICMFLITMCHAMVSAMTGTTIFVYVLWYGISNKRIMRALEVLAGAVSGILAAGIWIYPALKGGLLGLNQEALSEVMKDYTFPILQSVNPFLRFENVELFYFGFSVFAVSTVGILFGNKKSKAGFGVVLFVLLGTSKELLPLLVKIPLSQLFWTMRFVPFAMCMFFASLLMWKSLNKKLLYAVVTVIVVDSAVSFGVLAHNRQFPDNIVQALEPAVEISDNRVAVLDLSGFGSFPSYYLRYNKEGKKLQQVYGWAWQGADTSQNIVWLNTALENGWYTFMFDRCIELGADTLVVKRDRVEEPVKLLEAARQTGYMLEKETGLSLVFKYPVDYHFASKARYKGLGVGSYAENLAYVFPQFEVGESIYIDDYDPDSLLNYEVVYLSGFRYRNKKDAEEIVRMLSNSGVKVIIDLTNAESELYSSRAQFLGVLAQPVVFKGSYPVLKVDGKDLKLEENIPDEYGEWRTIYLENLDETRGFTEFKHQEMDFLGTKLNDRIVFLGLNLPFFTMETGDQKGIEVLESITGFEPYKTPDREIVRIEVREENNTLSIKAKEGNVFTGIACLDAFRGDRSMYKERHSQIFLEGRELKLKIVYPYLAEGIVLSLLGLLFSFLLYFRVSKRGKRCLGAGMEKKPEEGEGL